VKAEKPVSDRGNSNADTDEDDSQRILEFHAFPYDGFHRVPEASVAS
jgi:hypothetical protein